VRLTFFLNFSGLSLLWESGQVPVSQKKNNPNQIGGRLDTVQMSKKENVRLRFCGHGTCPDSKSVNHTIFLEKYDTSGFQKR